MCRLKNSLFRDIFYLYLLKIVEGWHGGQLQKIISFTDRKKYDKRTVAAGAGFSANIITRLKRNGYVSLESIESICRVLNCGVDDILEFLPEDNGGRENG